MISCLSADASAFQPVIVSLQKWFLGLAGVTGGVWAAARAGYLDSVLGAPPQESKVRYADCLTLEVRGADPAFCAATSTAAGAPLRLAVT